MMPKPQQTRLHDVDLLLPTHFHLHRIPDQVIETNPSLLVDKTD